MNDSTSRQAFLFSETIDSHHLFSLYENDYQWIEDIFKTALEYFDQDLDAIRENHQSGNIEGLKRSIHKIKPTFGFVGMPAIQNLCKEVETKIAAADGITAIMPEIENLLRCCEQCKLALQNDYHRLAQFNKSF